MLNKWLLCSKVSQYVRGNEFADSHSSWTFHATFTCMSTKSNWCKKSNRRIIKKEEDFANGLKRDWQRMKISQKTSTSVDLLINKTTGSGELKIH
ncbi:hypothetical protein NQ318_014819 [Aromia moschata]|uniref:Uncharacterized protein n=1 Tax=Aromia moschata TaxID=1265417 RepID=A0AAV8ZCD2_9CUCU|nr:hypothetical protein NQ318_014819 [Aromia moschata]